MALGSGNYEKVPMIEGSNHDEWAFFLGLYLIRTNMALYTQTDYVTAAAATLDVSSAEATSLINLGGVMLLSPAIVGILSDAELPADIGDRQALGQVAVGFPKHSYDLVCAPSLAHESLLDLSYPD